MYIYIYVYIYVCVWYTYIYMYICIYDICIYDICILSAFNFSISQPLGTEIVRGTAVVCFLMARRVSAPRMCRCISATALASCWEVLSQIAIENGSNGWTWPIYRWFIDRWFIDIWFMIYLFRNGDLPQKMMIYSWFTYDLWKVVIVHSKQSSLDRFFQGKFTGPPSPFDGENHGKPWFPPGFPFQSSGKLVLARWTSWFCDRSMVSTHLANLTVNIPSGNLT